MTDQYWEITWRGENIMHLALKGYVTLDACIRLNTSMERFLGDQPYPIDIIVDLTHTRILPPLAQLQHHLTFVENPLCEHFALICNTSPYLQKLTSYLFNKTSYRNVYSVEQAIEFFSSTRV